MNVNEMVKALASAPSRKPKCVECGRVFNLFDDDDANEWHFGHDCTEGEA